MAEIKTVMQQDPDSREAKMVVLRMDENNTPTVWCDPEIVDLVDALNNGKLATVASCSGHGELPFGAIALADGRELLILPNWDSARRAEAAVLSANAGKVEDTRYKDLLAAVITEIPHRKRGWRGNAPGHGHSVLGIWDSDNGALAGKPCAWCRVWNEANQLLEDTATSPTQQAIKTTQE